MEHAHKEMSASDRDRVLAELELLEVLLRVMDPRAHSKQYIKSNGSSSTLNAVFAKLLHTALVTYSVVTIVPGLPSTDHWPTNALRDQYYQLMLGSSSRANVDLTNIRSELRNVYPKNAMPKYEFVSSRYTRIGIPKDANQSIHILFFSYISEIIPNLQRELSLTYVILFLDKIRVIVKHSLQKCYKLVAFLSIRLDLIISKDNFLPIA